ncbi:hypothetical protein [Nonomuraea sp. SBT364]|uniref:hypothetical protein n=1 Tax=Nonomuraea sp. SBT364 TaxID=1580530 RepID=UPI00066A5270|nr:hypothetical protein [Nonomuraea sp. SBT364]
MKPNRLCHAFAGAALLLASGTAVPAASAAACAWTPSDLPVPAGTQQSSVTATNHQGAFSGRAVLADGLWHGVSWRNGQFVDHGAKVGDEPIVGLPDETRSGTVLAWTAIAAPPYFGPSYAILLKNGQAEKLARPADGFLRPLTINENGDVTGRNMVRIGTQYVHRLLRWPADRPGQVIETVLPGGYEPADADEDGTVLLQSPDGPALWRNGTVTPLAKIAGAAGTFATKISNGRVIGSISYTSPYRTYGVLWDTDGVPRVLPQSSDTRAVNRDGLITGTTDAATGGGVGIWRLGQFVHSIPKSPTHHMWLTVASDDGTVAGSTYNVHDGTGESFVVRCV